MTHGTNIQVRLNGQPRELEHGTRLDALVADLGLRPEIVAVELNERIVPRALRASTEIQDGDRLEIVTLVGGG